MTSSSQLQALLQATVNNPVDEATYQVLADWLEEHDDPRRAELLRLHRRLLATCCAPEQHPERADWQVRLAALLGEGVRPCVVQRTLTLGAGVEMVFSFIPPGSFLMGRPAGERGDDHELPQHRVTLTQGFYLGIHPVTQAQWQALMGNNPSHFKGDNRPVETVTWRDCQDFCRRLGEREGQPIRLPTEAEWEYACRAGTTTEYCSGNGVPALRRVGWCSDEGKDGSARETKPVGQFQSNAWGLFDMHGNVWERCQDGMRTYHSEDVIDPQGAGGKRAARALRGGSWFFDVAFCRAACRRGLAPGVRLHVYGLRVCFHNAHGQEASR
jgi:uncharacterized protein (TIGR02996 family)